MGLVVKEKYNSLLQRQKKAELILDDATITDDKKQKWMPTYLKIIEDLGVTLNEINSYTSVEVVQGFDVA